MKNLIQFNSLRGIILVVVGITAIYYFNQSPFSNYLDSSTASMPGVHLAMVENALTKHELRTSFNEVNLAIKSMNSVEAYVDSIANYYIENSISELEMLKKEIIRDSVNYDDLNHAFYETFMAMAYANLRLSELRLEEERQVSALEYFKISFSYLKRSLKYGDSNNSEKEEKVINEMRSILSTLKNYEDFERFAYNEINREMEELMENR